jgi:hypothetical protein
MELNKAVDQILNKYFFLIDKEMPNLINSFYIYGSAVSSDFHPQKSDIDFIAILNKTLKKEGIDKLQNIHLKIEKKDKRPNLNGIYVEKEDLGKNCKETKGFPYYFEGKMIENGYFECNYITWYMLKNRSICARGDEKIALSYHLDMNDLLNEMHENLNSYWVEWITKRKKLFSLSSIVMLFSKNEIEWGVLGVSRQFYTFNNFDITSKKEAGEYTIMNVPEKYKKIIQEAINIRCERKNSLYKSNIKRKKDALDLMSYLVEKSNQLYKNYKNKNIA